MRVGPYILSTRLGEGTTGVVWSGRHHQTGQHAAVKVASEEHAAPRLRRLFISEAHTLARLDHPNIIHIYDYGEVTEQESGPEQRVGQPWLAMEQMSGDTLQSIRGRKPWRELAPLMSRLLSALGHTHAQGVLHLDLKPENVLLGTSANALRLSDFGLAILQLPHNRKVASPALAAGTPTYMAPEQIRRDWNQLGPWTDLYALGILTWALAAGRAPFRGDTAAILQAHLERPLPALPPHAAWAEGLEDWLRKATAKAPRDRFQSAAEAAAALPSAPPYRPQRRRLPPGGLSLVHQRSPTLTGRDAEQAQLADLLSALRGDGRARAVVIRGRAGTGKSRLAEAAATAAAEAHGAVVVTAVHSRIPVPQDGLVPALERHLRCVGLDGEALDTHLDVLLGPSAEPALQRVRRTLLRPSDEPLRPQARFAAIARLLAALRAPVVMVLDDVQWGLDAISFARYLLGRPVPVLMLLSAQEEALSGQRAIRDAIRALQSVDGCSTISLSPLSVSERSALVDSVLPLAPALREAVAKRCEGYPIYAVQLVRDWAARGQLRRGPDGFERLSGASLTLPADLAAVWQSTIAQVLHDLPLSDGIALEVAAALGSQVNRKEWTAICIRQECPPSRPLLDRLIQRNLIRPRPGGFSFVHGMLRESLDQRAAAAKRRRGHHAAAAAWLKARGRDGDAERAAEHLLAVNEQAAALTLLLDAVEHRRRRGDVDRCRILLDRYEETLQTLRLPASDRRWAAGLSRRCKLEGAQGETERQLAAARALVARATAQNWAHERCLGQLALCSANRRQGLYHEALTLASEILEEGHRRGDFQLVAQAAWEQGLCLKNRGRSKEATVRLEEAITASRHVGDPILLAGVLLSYGYALIKSGHTDHAIAPILEAEGLYHAEGVRIGAANCANARGELLRLQGDLVNAAIAYRDAVEGHAGTAQHHVSRLNLCICLESCGEPAAALEIIDACLPELRRIGWENLIGAAHALALPCAAALEDWDAWDRHITAAEDSLCVSGFIDQDVEAAAARAARLAAVAGKSRRSNQALALARMQRLALL